MFERRREVVAMSGLSEVRDSTVSVDRRREFLESMGRGYVGYTWIGWGLVW